MFSNKKNIINTKNTAKQNLLFKRLLNLLNPNKPEKHRKMVFEYFKRGVSVSLDKEDKLYIYVHEFLQHSSQFSSEIRIIFTVDKVKNFGPNGSLILDNKIHENRVFEATLNENEEIIGKQVFYYTFDNLKFYELMIGNFESFVKKEYKKTEQIKKENDFFWNILKSKKPDDSNAE